MRSFPALSLVWAAAPSDDDIDRVLAVIDDSAPTALESQESGIRVFFSSELLRDQAGRALAASAPHIATSPLLVPDEDWAERSQASITAIQVGRVIVTPPWAAPSLQFPQSPHLHITTSPNVEIIILPSMGFGTGHHASTRLCLAHLQHLPLEGRNVIDVGTGSGVLAIASVRLGARRALGIDYDPDALQSAEDNVARNDVGGRVSLQAVDIAREAPLGPHDVLLGNLTGGMLIRHAARLVAEVGPEGVLITSGFQTHERDAVVAAFAAAGASVVSESTEDTWVAAQFRRATPA